MSTCADTAQTWADSHLLEPYWSVLGEMSEMVDLGWNSITNPNGLISLMHSLVFTSNFSSLSLSHSSLYALCLSVFALRLPCVERVLYMGFSFVNCLWALALFIVKTLLTGKGVNIVPETVPIWLTVRYILDTNQYRCTILNFPLIQKYYNIRKACRW